MNITSQIGGSIFDGITNTVAIAIARPNNERRKISFQFIGFITIFDKKNYVFMDSRFRAAHRGTRRE